MKLVTLSRPAPPPPVLGTLPEFVLEDQAGRSLRTADLDGNLWVVDFFFARCRSICPMLAERMHAVDRFAQRHPELAARTRLLSITVDPEHDTREVLGQYAAAHHVDGERWRLATGKQAPIADVVSRGFKMAVGAPGTDPATGDIDILHGGHLVLLDAQHRIRGYFDSDPESDRRLEAALLALAARELHP